MIFALFAALAPPEASAPCPLSVPVVSRIVGRAVTAQPELSGCAYGQPGAFVVLVMRETDAQFQTAHRALHSASQAFDYTCREIHASADSGVGQRSCSTATEVVALRGSTLAIAQVQGLPNAAAVAKRLAAEVLAQ